MSMNLFRLLERHQHLDLAITDEQRRCAPDPFRLQRLKRLKLAIKDRLIRLSHRKGAIGAL